MQITVAGWWSIPAAVTVKKIIRIRVLPAFFLILFNLYSLIRPGVLYMIWAYP
jgi:hypothetical protein